MPAPGSNRYDEKLNRSRRRLESEGHPDDDAARRASDAMREEAAPPSAAARGERAGGPEGGRGGGGDPGNAIELRSPAFSPNAVIPPRYTRPGDNVSPPLEWSEVPGGTVELALACEDPDAPGGTFTHWLLTGIDPATTSIGEGSQPAGATAWSNDFGDRGYDGPMPPIGDEPHRYFFRLFALGAPAKVEPGAGADAVRAALDDDHLATGTLVGLYVR